MHYDYEKQALYRNVGRLLVRAKIHLLKLEHLTFEGHMTLNKDEYQKYVWLKFRYCLVS